MGSKEKLKFELLFATLGAQLESLQVNRDGGALVVENGSKLISSLVSGAQPNPSPNECKSQR
jgi:hypothetical protein